MCVFVLQLTVRILRPGSLGETLAYRAQRQGGEVITMPGLVCSPVNPEVVTTTEGHAEWHLAADDLPMLLNAAWGEYKAALGPAISVVNL